MSGAAEFFEELRREYLTEAPVRLSELRKDLAAIAAGEADATASLKSRFHRLAGSGGSYGFPEISTSARAAEHWLIANPVVDPAGLRHLEAAIAGLAAIFDAAAVAVGLPASPPPGPEAFGWRALLLAAAGPEADAVHRILEDAQYLVDRKPLAHDPRDIPVSTRPDLVVIVATSAQNQLEEVVANWALPGAIRPGAVVLIAPPETADPLAQPHASLDLVIDADRAEPELLRFARALGRTATGPRSVLIIDPDAAASAPLASSLEGVQIRTEVAPDVAAARAAIGWEAWDALVVEWRLPDTTAPALIRWIRHQAGHRLTPVVVIGKQLTDDDRLAAVRAGADEVVPKTVAAPTLAQLIRARIDRSRTLRATAYRDDLTGLLNDEGIREELDRAISLARRAGEAVAWIGFDVDHLRRINEQHGQAMGDLVLVHVATALRGALRSSDLTARMGGEEFAALVRRCRLEDAIRIAEKVRAAVAELPIAGPTMDLRIRVSGGVACYPDHGATAADVLRAAERALMAAKQAGRDRIVAAS